MRLRVFRCVATLAPLGVVGVACGDGGAAGPDGSIDAVGSAGSGGSYRDASAHGESGGAGGSGGAIGPGGSAGVGGGGGSAGTGSRGSPEAGGGGASAGTGSGGSAGVGGGGGSAGTGSGGSPEAGGGVDSGGPADAGGERPCDIYASGGAPCVAAHSTVRALYGDFNGNLYQVTRASDKTTSDIGVLIAGGFADSAAQDTFCAGTTCTISVIYDQSPKGNHLTPGPGGGAASAPDNPANATALSTTISGHKVYGIRIDPPGMGYRIDKTSGIAIGDEPETEYMVTSSANLVNGCCFDYGNAETNNHDDGEGTMEAVYFGLGVIWGTGTGKGPWVEADLENGLWAGGGNDPVKGVSTNTPLTSNYVTAVVVGRSGSFALKGGNAQMGTLTTMYDGPRPNGGYNPMKKQGAIILGIGGDNSNTAGGDFYEGVMTFGNAPASTDDAVQANIVAAGYGN
jgi:non-reducing end alpha-L-arabinofuranosidase